MNAKTQLLLTTELKRDLIAEVVGHRFCLQPKAVRQWMDRKRIYNLNEIIERSKNFERFLAEIIEGGDFIETHKSQNP